MAVVVNPYIPFASVQNRETYLDLVRNVAHETQNNESNCLAYCWTQPIETVEAATDSSAFVQGLEVYQNQDALAVTHRSGASYLKMREVVSSQKLLDFPKGGVPLYKPAGAGFLSKQEDAESVNGDNLFLISRYTVDDINSASQFLAHERELCENMRSMEGVQTFFCFVSDKIRMDVSITIFVRLRDASHYDDVEQEIRSFEVKTLIPDVITKMSAWKGKGFGFFR